MRLDEFTVTVMLTVVRAVTVVVAIEKFAVVAPARTVTVAGGIPCALFDDIWMTYPPAGAGPLIVTVPVVGVPP